MPDRCPLSEQLAVELELMRGLHLTSDQAQAMSPAERAAALEMLQALPTMSRPPAAAGAGARAAAVHVWVLLTVAHTLLEAFAVACGWLAIIDAFGSVITRAPLTVPHIGWWFGLFIVAAVVTGRTADRAAHLVDGRPPRRRNLKEIVMLLPYWGRLFVGAVVAALVGYLIDAYVPLQPFAHIAAIVLYAIAVIAVVLGVVHLVFGYAPGRRRVPPPG